MSNLQCPPECPPATVPGLVLTNNCQSPIYLLASSGTSKPVHKTLAANGGTYNDTTLYTDPRSVKLATESADLAAGGPYVQLIYDYIDSTLNYSVNGTSDFGTALVGNIGNDCAVILYGEEGGPEECVFEVEFGGVPIPSCSTYTPGSTAKCAGEESLKVTLCAVPVATPTPL